MNVYSQGTNQYSTNVQHSLTAEHAQHIQALQAQQARSNRNNLRNGSIQAQHLLNRSFLYLDNATNPTNNIASSTPAPSTTPTPVQFATNSPPSCLFDDLSCDFDKLNARPTRTKSAAPTNQSELSEINNPVRTSINFAPTLRSVHVLRN